jgi:hypothetical protein
MRGTSAGDVLFDARRNAERGGGVVYRGHD